MVSLIRQAVEQCAGQGAESLPASLRAAHRLVPAERACRDIHFPEDFDALEQAKPVLPPEQSEQGLAQLQEQRAELDQAEAALLQGEQQLESSRAQLDQGQREYDLSLIHI